jgi:CO/xanthine dehydrogenase FAD-binding subunit
MLTLEEFLVGPQQNSLAPDELIVEVVVPLPSAPSAVQ